jgi:hypothetical protein
MKVKTSELTGAALDWAVAKALGVYTPSVDTDTFDGVKRINYGGMYPEWSTDWAGGGLIIERMGDYIQEGNKETGEYYCSTPSVAEEWHNHPVRGIGPTPLIAAMRCYVASELGDEVEIPEELA